MIWDWLQTSGQFLEKLATSYTTINVEWYSAVFYQICFLTSAIIFSSGVLVVGSYEVGDVWKCVLSLLKRFDIKWRLKTIIQHSTWARAFFAIVWKACSTFIASFALVSKYGMSFLEWHHCWARLVDTALLSRSILLPSTTNGKLSGSRGLACMGTISPVSGLRFTPHLDEKLVPPTVQRFEGVGRRHVVGEDAAVGAAVESDTEGLESLLTDWWLVNMLTGMHHSDRLTE